MPTSSLMTRSTSWSSLALVALFGTAACSPRSLVDVESPSNVVDPSQVENVAGAVKLRSGALGQMLVAFGEGGAGTDVLSMSGTITDELQDIGYYGASGNDRNVLNSTVFKNAAGYGYDQLQMARVLDRQARQALELYAANAPEDVAPRAWRGELYALEGYTIVWFAELYCSGIPLSESSLNGAQVPSRGLTTDDLLAHAIADFDSALTIGADSAQYVNLARVGKARALLDQGRFETADSVVRDVPTNFAYLVRSSATGGLYSFDMPAYMEPYGAYGVQDHEGGNGLVWSTDPRVAVVVPESSQTDTMLWAAKYNVDSVSGKPDPLTPHFGMALRLADGLEARLIQAEAALARGDGSWLTILNSLRTTCVGGAACAPRPGLTSAQLPPLLDPGTPDARVDTLMKERAMWLYLTGHREGDLRRMAHIYHRDPQTLWPTGTIHEPPHPPLYPDPGRHNNTPYGTDVVYGPDASEQLRNPLYSGCYDTTP